MDNFDNNFKQSDFPKNKRNFSKFFTPFLAGVLGASFVVGICFGIPEIKSSIFNSESESNITTNTTNSNTSSETVPSVNFVKFSDTSVAVAEKVLPSIVGIKIKYTVNSLFGSTEAEATGSGIIINQNKNELLKI